MVFTVIFFVETVLHVWFCVKFWQFQKKQGHSHKERHLIKANHIVLFQIITQSVLCMIPNTIRFANMQFFQLRIYWMWVLSQYYGLLFSTNIALSAMFVVYKMWDQRRSQKVNSIIVTTQHSRTTG
uniref:7TM_GPCR_Srx domain-containing protein n=1 Tax=Steinernema glaseri TaxID=37863 RepID=A0A1I7ZEJ9_9BILA